MKLEQSAAPKVVARDDFQSELDKLRVREKAHTKEGDAIAAARRRMPMVNVDGSIPLIGPRGPTPLIDVFEGRRMLLAYYFMWHNDKTAAQQCEGCTWFTSQIQQLAQVHSRDVTYATIAQGRYDESVRYRDFMGLKMPWYGVDEGPLAALLDGRKAHSMYLISYLRQGDDVFETYWTNMRGVEAMDNNYRLLDLTIYGRQETWEDSPAGWPQGWGDSKQRMRIDGRPVPQWDRIKTGCDDTLSGASTQKAG